MKGDDQKTSEDGKDELRLMDLKLLNEMIRPAQI